MNCAWEGPKFVKAIPYECIADIPFTKPKNPISCNKRIGARLYSNDVPDSQLLKPRLEE